MYTTTLKFIVPWEISKEWNSAVPSHHYSQYKYHWLLVGKSISVRKQVIPRLKLLQEVQGVEAVPCPVASTKTKLPISEVLGFSHGGRFLES